MQVIQRALALIGLGTSEAERRRSEFPRMMREALHRLEMAQHMLREAHSLEQLDLARSSFMQAQAEVQQVIRLAKRERGIALRPVSETEEMYRRMRDHMNPALTDRAQRRRTGTTSAERPG